MIAGIFHAGSGLGNQLMRYVMTRCLAQDKGVDFGMVNPELFKGKDFMNLDMGKPVQGIGMYFTEEKQTTPWNVDVRGYDGKISMIKDNTLIDGEFQDFQYWGHRLDEIREWLAFRDPLTDEDLSNTCIINFRGGEYTAFPELFLGASYWQDAINHMRSENPQMKFEVVTDDVPTARLFFPTLEITHDREADYKVIQHTHYLILSNSSFAIFPALLNKDVKKVIAPKYWARHNVSNGWWCTEQNIYPNWWYMDTDGNLEQTYNAIRTQ